jgi:hypothetical protein
VRCLRDVPPPGDWAERAACKGTAPTDGTSRHPFFPSRGELNKSSARQLRLICDACPVEAHCRHYALRHPVTGWWGGLSEEARSEWRRRQREREAS